MFTIIIYFSEFVVAALLLALKISIMREGSGGGGGVVVNNIHIFVFTGYENNNVFDSKAYTKLPELFLCHVFSSFCSVPCYLLYM